MRSRITLERGGKTHERVKEYARERAIRHPRAYAELIKKGLEAHEQEREEEPQPVEGGD